MLVATLSSAIATRVSAATSISSCQTLAAGNYIVTQDISTSGTCFIVVSNTVVDLQGHTISGNGTESGFTDNGSEADEVVIANGTINNFDIGINLRNKNSSVEAFDQLTVSNNAGDGILVKNCCSSFTNIKATNNGGNGIESHQCCSTFENIQASNNGADGILGGGCCSLASDATANANAGSGIELGDCCNAVDDSVTNSNTGTNGSSNKGATGNAGEGILFSLVDDNCCADDNFVRESTANNNAGDGMSLGDNCCSMVDHSGASGNGGDGVVETSGFDLITNSTFNNNQGNGMNFPPGDDREILTGDIANGNRTSGVTVACPSSIIRLSATGNPAGKNLVETGGTCSELGNKAP